MLSPMSDDIIRAQIAWRLDCAPANLSGSQIIVKQHGPHFADYHGLYAWLMDDAAIISTPPQWVEVVETAISGQAAETLRDPAFWHTAFGTQIERIVGPSYQGYTDAAAFQPTRTMPPDSPNPTARRIDPDYLPALERLANACPPQEWQDSAIHLDHTPIFVLEQAGEFVAAASAPDDGPGIASVGVITHPAWRGRGYGAIVVGALTAARLTEGAILHYQTLRSNVASVAVAHALGYQDMAIALGIRLSR